jgi:hypothetical protein
MKNERGNSNRRYVCLDRRVGNNLYDFYNCALAEREARAFEEHLLFCFRCQEEILTLDLILNTLKEADTFFQLGSEIVPAGGSSELA